MGRKGKMLTTGEYWVIIVLLFSIGFTTFKFKS